MTKEEAFKEINDTQGYYVNELINLINDKTNDCFKTVNFTSPTGTGKTNMMSLLCNKLNNYYFIITTLSKGQLNKQIRTNMEKLVKQDNFMVYGLCDYTSNTRLTATEIISRLPVDKQIIWLRDEGHINTNKWQEVLADKCFKVVNFSATNKEATGIVCNFTNTMMLRTVQQNIGTPEEALDKLLEIKVQHSKIKNYNPCAIMRCLDEEIEQRVINACIERNLSYINITTEGFDMSDLCKDDNEYDVILNKFKIVEGIDIRRAHVLYMTNEPKNPATTIQIIGRCRRNALLYRNDTDILKPNNKKLLENTRQCFVYYNIENMNIDEDASGELCQAFCETISCQELKPNSIIEVINGQLANGLKIIELARQTGKFEVLIDKATGFNIIKPEGEFYKKEQIKVEHKLYGYTQLELLDENRFKRIYTFNFATGEYDKNNWKIKLPAPEFIDLTLDIKQLPRYNLDAEIFNVSCSAPVIAANGKYVVHFIENSYNNSSCEQESRSNRYFKDLAGAQKFINTHKYKIFYTEYTPKKLFTEKDICRPILSFNYRFHSLNDYNKTSTSLYFNTIAEALNAYNKLINNRKYIMTDYRIKLDDGTVLKFPDSNYMKIKVKLTQKYILYYKERSLSNLEIENYFKTNNFIKYDKVANDKESAIIGTDIMKAIRARTSTDWIEDKAVTGKVTRYSKLNTFIKHKYNTELTAVKSQLFNGKNSFKFNTKCNSCLGYLVEYYSKYLVYGEGYLGEHINAAMKESKVDYINDYIIIRACMLKYREMMAKVYGNYIGKIIKTISIEQLIKDDYKEFVATVIKLGKRTAEFVKANLVDDGNRYDPNLSIRHISGLADYINHDTIIDIKTTSNITEQYIRQVLAYHYLSTKRSDLDIKHLIVYDAVTDKCARIDFE